MSKDTGELEHGKAGVMGALIERFRGREDSEHEQAFIRVWFPLLFLLYLGLVPPETFQERTLWDLGFAMSSGFLVFSLGLLAAIAANPAPSVWRRLIGAVGDLGILSVGLALIGELAAPWWWVYLWVTFGNGFRYGVRFLYFSAALSLIGFALASLANPFWQAHTGLTFGLLAALVILPGYVAILLRRLNAATRHAEEASRAKSDFLARMSHEIRTPLNGIIGLSELLKSCKLGVEEREYANTIHDSGHALLSLIEDVLDISKIEAGKISIEKTGFDLHALIGGTLRMFSPQAEAKSLRLASHISPDTPFRVQGDPQHLRQVLINLVGNAIKFTEQGSVELRCHPARIHADRALVRFQILDTGIGIPEEVQPRIFEKFSQADESTTRRYGGTGLGTSIAKQLVELMNGRIGFESTPGIGTNFWFDIELQCEPDATPEPASLGDCRILRLCPAGAPGDTEIARCLKGWKLESDSVHGIRDAVAALLGGTDQQTPFEVLILDQIEPGPEIERFVESLDSDLALYDLTVLAQPSRATSISADSPLRRRAHVLPHALDKALLFNALHASYAGSHDDTVISFADHLSRRRPAARELRVLVAEDNPTNRMVTGRILERAGFHHRLVEDGHQVLEALEEEHFDVAIVDMQMPGLGGIEAYKLYRFAHADADDAVPFIVLTANATVEARRHAREAGIAHYLTKPVGAGQLLGAIEAATGGPRAGLSPAEPGPERADGRASDADPPQEIDPRQLGELLALASGPDFGDRLLQGFHEDGLQLLEQMAQALEGDRIPELRSLVHALKGNAANLGLVALSSRAASVEQLSDLELSSRGGHELEAMARHLHKALEALREELRRRPATGGTLE